MSAFVHGNKKGFIVEGETDYAGISVNHLHVFEQETEEQIAGKLTNLFGLGNLQCGNVCPSCCDILRDATLNVIKVQVLDTLRSKNLHGRRLDLSFKIDPVIDLLRITARNVIFESAEKLSSFPSLSDVCHKFMRQSLRSLNIGNSSDSTVVVGAK